MESPRKKDRRQGLPERLQGRQRARKKPGIAEEPTGALYLAPAVLAKNPFDSLIALYIVAKPRPRDPRACRGRRSKQNPVTGQITTTFDTATSRRQARPPRRVCRSCRSATSRSASARARPPRWSRRRRAASTRSGGLTPWSRPDGAPLTPWSRRSRSSSGYRRRRVPVRRRPAVRPAGLGGHGQQRRRLLQPARPAHQTQRRRTGDHGLLNAAPARPDRQPDGRRVLPGSGHQRAREADRRAGGNRTRCPAG